jgi:mannosyltransferase OCH1-like enzyme
MINFIKNRKKIEENRKKIEENRKKIEENRKLNININKIFIFKNNYNSIIPLNLFTCWHTKDLPPLMRENYELLKNSHPRFNHYLFDENDCREFIKNNFKQNVLDAYNSLIPCAYKADLWRYCILYINGGIYIDIKYKPINNFRLIELTEKEHWVLDADKRGVYNALIVCKAGNKILLNAINQIVINVKNNFYGNNALEPTGPLLLEKFFTTSEKNSFDITHEMYFSLNNRFIIYNNFFIFRSYNGYKDEEAKNQKHNYYGELWNNKDIYKK